MFRKILVGNDGSDGAKKALKTALNLATRDDAELHEISIEEHLPRYGALMGELDSVLVPEHPLADSEPGPAHACGHPMQLAAMLGAGMGLVRSGVLGDLAGRLILFAVPAEEYVEVE